MKNSVDYLIVGSGIAGFTAASEIRKRDKKSDILILSEEPVSFYSKVLLPDYLSEKIKKEKIFLKKLDWFKKQKIRVLLNTLVKKIDTSKRQVYTEKSVAVSYKKLLVTSGVRPRKLPVTNGGEKNIFYLWDLRDAEKLLAAIQDLKKLSKKEQKAVVVGGGFICQTFLKIFLAHGIETHLMMRGAWYWSKFISKEAGQLLEQEFLKNKIILHKEERVREVVRQNNTLIIKTEKGKRIETGLVLVGVGTVPNVGWLQDSDIKMRDGIVVNEYMKTNRPNIWAAGDVVNFYDPFLGDYHRQGNWVNASRQGRVAAINMTGGREKYQELTAFTVDVFGLPFIFLGEYDRRLADEVVVRVTKTDKKVREFYFKGERLIGATLVNASEDRLALEKAIKNKIRLNKKQKLDLAEWSISLNKSKLYGAE